MVPEFERCLASYCAAPHAVAVSSATAALHMACEALGVGPGDRVWTSPISFVASANCARFCGASVDFVDIDPLTRNMSLELLQAKLVIAEHQGTLPKVVIPVHFAGSVCDMAALAKLAQKYGFFIIEDAAHAIGGSYGETPVGACQYSDVCVFSFHPVKTMTTGEGGVAMTKNAELADKMRRFCSHGIIREPSQFCGQEQGAWVYEMQSLGVNYRMTDMQAALGIQQLKKLPQFVTKRRALWARYQEQLADLAVILPAELAQAKSAWHLYVIELREADRRQVFDRMRAHNIGVNVHYIPIHMQPYYQTLGFKAGDFPNSEAYYQRALSLPLFPDLSAQDQDSVVAELREAIK